MRYKIPLLVFLLVFQVSHAQVVTVSNTQSTSTASTTRKYIVPKEGVRIKLSDANFSIFPEKLNFSVEKRNIFLISRYWQTGCLYDSTGSIIISTSTKEKICMQTATGKKDVPTELGLYNIQTKHGKNYRSSKYTISGEELTATSSTSSISRAAPMPYAMHIGRIIGKLENNKLIYDFSDGAAIHERQTVNKYGSVSFVSHGCIAIEKGRGPYLQSLITYGDLVSVFDQHMPNSLDEAISINK